MQCCSACKNVCMSAGPSRIVFSVDCLGFTCIWVCLLWGNIIWKWEQTSNCLLRSRGRPAWSLKCSLGYLQRQRRGPWTSFSVGPIGFVPSHQGPHFSLMPPGFPLSAPDPGRIVGRYPKALSLQAAQSPLLGGHLKFSAPFKTRMPPGMWSLSGAPAE